MAMNFVPLDKNKHQSLKVAVQPKLSFAKEAHIAAASVREYAQLASTMPIVFIKDPNGTHFSVAMLGVEQKQNLFLTDGDRWKGPHIPMNILRYPFDIRPDGDKLGVFIDENSDLISDEGEPLFNGDEPSDFLKNRQQFLSELANSEVITQRFVGKLVEHDLLEELQIRVVYQSGQQKNLTGMLSINEKKLLDLPAETVAELHKNGFIGAAYTVMVSLGQLNRLVELTNNTDNPIQSMQIIRSDSNAQAAESAATTEAPNNA